MICCDVFWQLYLLRGYCGLLLVDNIVGFHLSSGLFGDMYVFSLALMLNLAEEAVCFTPRLSARPIVLENVEIYVQLDNTLFLISEC